MVLKKLKLCDIKNLKIKKISPKINSKSSRRIYTSKKKSKNGKSLGPKNHKMRPPLSAPPPPSWPK